MILVFRLFNMVENQNAPDLNKGLSSNFWWLKIADHVKFTEECAMCMENHVLVIKKEVYKWAKCLFTTTSLSRKDSYEKWKHSDSLVKKSSWRSGQERRWHCGSSRT